ncbi:EAL domain-containing protein [Arthrobacter oryzae]|nr:EAL domain-containing protein [Arthrobacter oryzae]
MLAVLSAVVIPATVFMACRVVRQQGRERVAAARTAALMESVLATSSEWLWALDPAGCFSFSSPVCREVVGYEPAELFGRHISAVFDPEDLEAARRDRRAEDGTDIAWTGVVMALRHRAGHRVLVEVSGRPLRDGAGTVCGFEGTGRTVPPEAGPGGVGVDVRERIDAMLTGRTWLTAFQPIRSLGTGRVIGVEALTRFLSSPGSSPETWFTEAAHVGRGVELEILTLRSALTAAAALPGHLYVAVNLSPQACLSPELAGIFDTSGIALHRIVLEVTERQAVQDYEPLAAALETFRSAGLRIAVDDAGAGFASMRHILQLKPDLIKLDRGIIAGIDTDPGQQALGAAMVGFAAEIGAVLVAEGIETDAELSVVSRLGMGTGQGYLLGRPSVVPEEWDQWRLDGPSAGRRAAPSNPSRR